MGYNSITVGLVDGADQLKIKAFAIGLAETGPVVTVDVERLRAAEKRSYKATD